MTDKTLEKKIEELQTLIIKWAKKNHVWDDSCFKSYFEHFDDEPNEVSACVTVLCSGNGMSTVLNCEDVDLLNEFDSLMDSTEFWYEMYDHTTTFFYARKEKLNKKFLDFFEWQWVSDLVRPNYTSLYGELYEYFVKQPEKFYFLKPRQLEILISEIFRNQGYYTELGPGWNDGGVDLRIYQKDDIDQIVTLVQVKKYKQELPIGLESVAYLQSIVDDEKANRGLFITTSRYLPQAEKFALRQKKRLKLATNKDIAEWCDKVKTVIIRDKSAALEDATLLNLIRTEIPTDLTGRIVHANTGYGMITNDFCMIVKDSPEVVLLIRLSTVTTESFDPPHNFRGKEIPLRDESILKYKTKDDVFRAKKSSSNQLGITFWGQKHLYTLWDGTPQYFDHLD